MPATHPISQIIALYTVYAYGVMLLLFSSFATVWKEVYHQTASQSGLNYLSVMVGSSVTSLAGGPVNDKI